MPKKKPEPEFMYVIARPWNNKKDILEPDNMCTYAYGSEMHTGTEKSAERMLGIVQAYVEIDDQNNRPKTKQAKEYRIVKLVPVVLPLKEKL